LRITGWLLGSESGWGSAMLFRVGIGARLVVVASFAAKHKNGGYNQDSGAVFVVPTVGRTLGLDAGNTELKIRCAGCTFLDPIQGGFSD
jgi:hypothetical protein